MSWYYAENNQRVGPVTDADFQELVKQGRIGQQTLVWRENMENWTAFGELEAKAQMEAQPGHAVSPAAVCSECNRLLPADEMVAFEGRSICAACKPHFFQKVIEGADIPSQLNYAGFWVRAWAFLLDGMLLFVFLRVLLPPLGLTMQMGDRLSMLVVFVIVAAYQIYFTGKEGATPGKMAVRIRVVRTDGSPVGYRLAAGRYLARELSALICLAGFIMVAFDEEKRGLHDRICDTRVIRE